MILVKEVTIHLPNILDKKKYLTLSPQDQEEYIERKIKEIVFMNDDGVTIPDIDENVPFTRPTIIKHLEKLVALRESYKIKRRNVTVYYPNGKIVHAEKMLKDECLSGTQLKATFLNNKVGKFVFLEDVSNNKISGGSMLLKRDDLSEFVKFMQSVNKTLTEIEGVENNA